MSPEKPSREAKLEMLSLLDKEGRKTHVLEKLDQLYQAGKYGPFNLFVDKTNVPLGLSSKTVWELVHGKKKKAIRRDYFEYLVTEFKISAVENISSVGFSQHDIPNVRLIDDDGNPTSYLKEIREHHHRTGVGVVSLLREQIDIPDGLNISKIENWLNGKAKSASQLHLNYVLNLWKNLPDADIRCSITNEKKEKLSDLFSELNLSPKIFVKNVRKSSPEDLTSAMIEGWMKGHIKSALNAHLDFVMNELARLANQRKENIIISDEILDMLNAEKQRTGVSPKTLLRGANNLPEGLVKDWVAGWLSGRIDKAEKAHLDYVLSKWSSLPKAGWYSAKTEERLSHEKMPRKRRIPPVMMDISEEIRGALQSKFDKSGITQKAFIARFSPVPDKLVPSTIGLWMSGASKKAKKSQLEFVLNNLDKLINSLPERNTEDDSANPISQRVERATIKQSDVLEMKMHQKRTGIGGGSLLKSKNDAPEGLTGNMISAWINGYVYTAPPFYLQYVLESWRELPDAKN